MKVLFLDFDGVLNHSDFFQSFLDEHDQLIAPIPNADERLDGACVAQLNRVVEATGAKIVVSSTWRLFRSVSELQTILNRFGFVGEVIDKTTTLNQYNYDRRSKEIDLWLLEHPEVEMFAVVDDDLVDGFHECFVQTKFHGGGLTSERADQLIRVLNGAL